MSQIRILTIGDVVGPAALDTLSKVLFPLRNEYKADFVIVNGENAAPGNVHFKGGPGSDCPRQIEGQIVQNAL